MPGKAPPQLHHFAVDVAQTLGDVDQAEWNQDHHLDEDHTEIAGLEPNCCEYRPADRGKRVEQRLDALVNHRRHPRHAVGEEGESAADQKRCGNSDQHSPTRGKQIPEEIRRDK